MLLLDEPTSGMGHEDVDRIAELIRKVSATAPS
jgi:branched-chain amino acid transport system ATP-binding protein